MVTFEKLLLVATLGLTFLTSVLAIKNELHSPDLQAAKVLNCKNGAHLVTDFNSGRIPTTILQYECE